MNSRPLVVPLELQRSAAIAVLLTALAVALTADWTTAATLADRDPIALVPAAQFGGSVHGMLVNGSTAYLAAGSRLVVLDVSNPGNPIRQAELDLFPAQFYPAAIDGTRLYVLYEEYGPFTGGTVAVIDVSLPWRPRLGFR